MSEEYFVMIKEEQQGPYDLKQLQQLWLTGKVDEKTLFCTPGMDQWNALQKIAGRLAPDPKPEEHIEKARPQDKWEAVGFTLGSTGWLMVIGGMIGALIFAFMDIGVGSEAGQVVNFSLIHKSQTGMILCMGAALLGGLLLIVDQLKQLNRSK